jgi:hypothetical protein
MFDRFKARAEAVSAEVHRVPDAGAAVDFVLALLEQERVADAPGARGVVRGADPRRPRGGDPRRAARVKTLRRPARE